MTLKLCDADNFTHLEKPMLAGFPLSWLPLTAYVGPLFSLSIGFSKC
jgi:hypothetical protein